RCAWPRRRRTVSRYSRTPPPPRARRRTRRWRRRSSSVSAKARGLGRGLDALLPKVDKGIQQVPVAKVEASPLQPRHRFDEAAIAELADSVRERGVLQPILVRPSHDGYEVVAGERRLR